MTSIRGPADAWLWNLLDDEQANLPLAGDALAGIPSPARCFLTFRTPNALSAKSLRQLHRFRDEWLRRRGLDPGSLSASGIAESLSVADAARPGPHIAVRVFAREYARRWFAALDDAPSGCELSAAELRATVAGTLDHFNRQGCRVCEYLILPSRLHVLLEFGDEPTLVRQTAAWLAEVTSQLNRCLGRRGPFWRRDDCDHLVQSREAWSRRRRFLAATPARLGLSPNEYTAWTRDDVSPG